MFQTIQWPRSTATKISRLGAIVAMVAAALGVAALELGSAEAAPPANVTASLQNGTLVVAGTNNDDNITIQRKSDNALIVQVVVGGNGAATIGSASASDKGAGGPNGEKGKPSKGLEFSLADINTISMDGKSGNDVLTLNEALGALRPRPSLVARATTRS